MSAIKLGLSTLSILGSLVIAGTTLTLVNDSVAPGNNYFYGTGPTGTKGWFTLASGNVTSIAGTAGQVLVNGLTTAQTGAVTLSLPSALTGINSVTTAAATDLTLTAGNGNVVKVTSTTNFARLYATTNQTDKDAQMVVQNTGSGGGSIGTAAYGPTAAGSDYFGLSNADLGVMYADSLSALAIGTYTSAPFHLGTNNTKAITISTAQVVSVLSATTATNTTSGALVVAGGVGVGGSIYSGGSFFTVAAGLGVTYGANSVEFIRAGDSYIDHSAASGNLVFRWGTSYTTGVTMSGTTGAVTLASNLTVSGGTIDTGAATNLLLKYNGTTGITLGASSAVTLAGNLLVSGTSTNTLNGFTDFVGASGTVRQLRVTAAGSNDATISFATATKSQPDGIVFSDATGNLLLQSVVGSAITLKPGTTTGNVNVSTTTNSTNSTTGSLLIGNGSAATNVGIGGGNIFAGGAINSGGDAKFGTGNSSGSLGIWGATPNAAYGINIGSSPSGTNIYGITDQNGGYNLNGAATEIMSYRAYPILTLGANNLTNWYGFSSQIQSKSGAGTLTNAYAFYAVSPTAATNNYAFYSTGTAPSVFGGVITVSGTGTSSFAGAVTIAHNASAVNLAITNTTNLALASLNGNASTATGFFSNVSNQNFWEINRNPITGVFTDTGRTHSQIKLTSASGGSTIIFSTSPTNNTAAVQAGAFDKDGNLAVTGNLTTGGTVGAPPSSGSTFSGAARFGASNNIALDAGPTTTGYTGYWIQAHDKTDMSVNYTLALQPNGGATTMGGNLTVSGTGTSSVAGLLTSTAAGGVGFRYTLGSVNVDTQADGSRGYMGTQSAHIFSLLAGNAIAAEFTNSTLVATFKSTTSGTSTTAAAILGKSMGLTENLFVGGSTWTTTAAHIGSATVSNLRLNQTAEVIGTPGGYGGMSLTTYYTTGAGYSILDFNHAKTNTPGLFTALANGDGTGAIVFRGADGTGWVSSAYIEASVDNTVSTGVMPGKLLFATYDASGVARTALTINSAQVVALAGTTEATTGGAGSLTTAGGFFTTKRGIIGTDLFVTGGQSWGVTNTVTAAGTTVLTNASKVLQVFTGATTQTVTLPAASATGAGYAVLFVIKNRSAGAITINRAGSDLIDGATSYTLPGGSKNSVTLLSDGVSEWEIT